jgi:hypothetical protein
MRHCLSAASANTITNCKQRIIKHSYKMHRIAVASGVCEAAAATILWWLVLYPHLTPQYSGAKPLYQHSIHQTHAT